MGIELKQYTGATVTAQDDAIMYDRLIDDSGIIKGCNVHFVSVNVVNISEGWGVIKGRLFKITDTTLSCILPDSAGVGVIKVRMDLSNIENPVQILSVVNSGSQYPELEQDKNCNYNSGIYEIELARYRATETAITDIEETFWLINHTSIRTYKNKKIEASAWKSDSTYQNKNYKASIKCPGVTQDYRPDIVFADETCGINKCDTGANVVNVYHETIPSGDIMINNIVCTKID